MAREITTLTTLQKPAVAPADFQIVVPCRETRFTRAALKYAASLTNGLNVRLRLIDVHVVPYGVPLDRPTVNVKYVERRLRNLVHECSFPVSPEIVYARDWEQGLRRSLGPGSVVLIAFQRSWWRSSEKRLANRLRKLGHQVIWVDCDAIE